MGDLLYISSAPCPKALLQEQSSGYVVSTTAIGTEMAKCGRAMTDHLSNHFHMFVVTGHRCLLINPG